jgi:hypothetical protein
MPAGAPSATPVSVSAAISHTAAPQPAAAPGPVSGDLGPQAAGIATRMRAAAAVIADKRKRDSVDRAIDEFQKRAGSISPAAMALLEQFTLALGTPNAKAIWSGLVDNHWNDVSAFSNVKYL